MKIATWNVNGFRAREAQFLEWVRRDRPDVVCLQEIKATPEQLGETLTMLPEYWSYWHGGPKGYSGVSLHVRKDAFAGKPEFSHPPFDAEYRVVQARLSDGLVVASVYVPNGGKDFGAKLRFLEAMGAYVAGALEDARPDVAPCYPHGALALAGAGRLVLCGDMNVARTDKDVTPRERNPATIGQRPDERQLFERMLASGLVDVGRALDPESETTFTWWPPWREQRQKNRGWRIDYVLASANLRPIECRVLADVGTSDHAPVVATLE